MQHNFVFKLTFYPFQDKINKLPLIHMPSIYSLDTLQTRWPFYYSFRFTFQIQFRYAPNTDAILILIHIFTVQIRSRQGFHSVTHSDSPFRYNSDTLQTRMPFCYLFRSRHQIQSRYAPDSDVILILIQIQHSDTLQIRTAF